VLTKQQIGTRYVAVLFRTFMDSNDAADVKARFPIGIRTSARSWAPRLGALMAYVPDSRRMFGNIGTVDSVRHLIGTAAGWGVNPVEDAKYISGVVKLNDGNTPHVLTVRDVPVNGFWSVTVYNANGFYEEPEKAISVNNVTGKRKADGSMTIRFGGDPAAENYLRIMPGWSYIVRLYRPRPEVVAGQWTSPEPTPVH